MTSKEKEELKARCDALIYGNKKRKSWTVTGRYVQQLLVSIGLPTLLPTIGTKKKRISRGRSIAKIYRLYLKYLIEESLKYPIDIYIKNIGILKISEVDSVGKKSLWKEDGKLVFRMDTPFDRKVKYWMQPFIFGYEMADFTTRFQLQKRYIKPILRKIYLKHPDGGFYPTYKKEQ